MVENIIVHPDYVPEHPSNQHDLAVIKIREDETNKNDKGNKQTPLWNNIYVQLK